MTTRGDLAATLDTATGIPSQREDGQPYRIGGLAEATWAMRKLRDIERKRAEIRSIAEEEIDRVQQWATAEDGKFGHEAGYFTALLIDYALRQRAEDPRRKSVSTPHGVVHTRESGGGWTAGPEALEWARKARPDLVRVTEAFALADARKALTATEAGVVDPTTGDLVPGVTVAPKTVTASVDVDLTEGDPR